MCAPKIPPAPAAPDYAAANREAVMADIETLPQRRRIEAEARLGTGQFEGLGDADLANAILMQQLKSAPEVTGAMLDLQKQYGTQFAEEARRQLQATDPTGFGLRESLANRLASGGGMESLLSGQTGTPAGPDYAAYVRNNPDLLANWNNNTSKNTSLSIEEYGRQHYEASGRGEGRNLPMTEGTRGTGLPSSPYYERVGNGPNLQVTATAPSLMELADPEALRSTAQAVSLERAYDPEALRSTAQAVGLGRLGSAPELQSTASRIGLERMGDPEALRSSAQMRGLERLSSPEALRDAATTSYGRQMLEQQVYDDLAQAGTLDPALRRAAEQAARARGSARGNILGDSSALEEALSVQLAQREQDAQRRAAALGVLSSGQTATDVNARLGQQNLQNQAAAIEQRNRSALGETEQELSLDAARNAAIQQNIQNRAAALGQRNTASQAELENAILLDEARNRALQQNFLNRATVVGQQNAATQAELENALSLDAARNAALQQNIQNRYTALGQRNLASQAELENVLSLDAARNAALQQNIQNRANTAQQRNLARQAGFENVMSLDAARNTAGQQAFNNVMNAIQQRNQAAQSDYGAQVANLGLRTQARQQDLANIQSFLGLQPIVSQGGQLAGLQQGAAPFMTGQYQGVNIDPSAGAQGSYFAANIFGQQSKNWATQSQYAAQGGILNTLGKISDIAGNLGSAYAGFSCHVAREIYGQNNPDWVRFYFWKEDKAPWWFRLAYNRWSREIAAAIRPFPKLKAKIRAWMDSKINTESKTYG